MSIKSDSARLRRLVSTKQGWANLEAAWMTAMNNRKDGDSWISNSHSKGNLVVGFAIDPISKKIILDTNSRDHSWAKNEMIEWLRKDQGLDLEAAENRPVRGWAGKILDFNFPCIFMADSRFMNCGGFDYKFVRKLERAILEQEIGLPLNSLFMRQLE